MTLKQKIEKYLCFKLLGIGSAKDLRLKANLFEAAKALNLNLTIKEVKDINQFLKFDIAGIPALLKDGEIIFQKIVPTVSELKLILHLLRTQPKHLWNPQQVLVPIDFSELSDKAIDFAAILGRKTAAPLQLVHVHNPALIAVMEDVEIKDTQKAYKEALLNKLSGVVQQQNLSASAKLVEGFPAEMIRNLSKEIGDGLIIMSTTGQQGLFEQLFGSVSSTVMKRASCPVLIVPPNIDKVKIEKIAFAHTFHREEITPIHQSISLAEKLGATFDLVNVDVQPDRAYYHDIKRIKLPEVNQPIGLVQVESSSVVDGLNEFISKQDVDLLVMSTQNRNFFDQLFHKSMTLQMMTKSNTPLLIFHY